MDDVTRPEALVEVDKTSWTRRLLLWGLPLVVVVVGVYFYGSAGRFVSTDNAYVQQDRVDVVPQVSANVLEVGVAENTHVAAGQPILKLDDSMYRIAVAAADSKLTAARADVETMKAAYVEKNGEIAVARRAAELTMRDYKRQEELA